MGAAVVGEDRDPGALGEACDADTPCDAAFCDDGFCAAPQSDGAPCASSLECASGRCIDDVCTPLPGACIDG